MKKKILFVCGSMNQTTQMHQISDFLGEYDLWLPLFSVTGFSVLLPEAVCLSLLLWAKGEQGRLWSISTLMN